MPLFTVFTPTYNRADKLHRVYESLLRQTFRDFEWLIIDDGSIDNTRQLVNVWINDAPFPIRYFYQKNGHKKTAYNQGVKFARGELILPADSDDRFHNDALEHFATNWFNISPDDRGKFAGVCGLCVTEKGDLVGGKFPGSWGVDSDASEIRFRFGVTGEKWGFCRKDLLASNPFPEHLPGHVPEDVVWVVIGTKFKTRFINTVVRTYYQDAANQVTENSKFGIDAAGMLFWKKTVLSYQIKWMSHKPIHFLLEAARWVRFRLHLPKDQLKIEKYWPDHPFSCFLILTMFPLGFIWWLYDIYRRK